ncbi:MAG: hypothetical protein J6386_11175 [Candidatus Synoicihabitans palmerolidicus]|nr:hypothetical protein [Candidatus Synoicihabitans palmerolidicus]
MTRWNGEAVDTGLFFTEGHEGREGRQPGVFLQKGAEGAELAWRWGGGGWCDGWAVTRWNGEAVDTGLFFTEGHKGKEGGQHGVAHMGRAGAEEWLCLLRFLCVKSALEWWRGCLPSACGFLQEGAEGAELVWR